MYILDTPDKVFQFNGANATRSEQGKALEVTQAIKSLEHEGKCEVAIIGQFSWADLNFRVYNGVRK